MTAPRSSETFVRPGVGPFDLCWGLAKQVVDCGVRRFTHTVARRGMQQVRRHPADLVGRLQRARRVLVVCQGNIIRSPFAAELLRQRLGAATAVAISSAGLEAVPGKPPHPIAIQMANRRCIDLTGHTASRLTPDVVAASDVILVMDVPQLSTVRKRFPAAAGKTFLLASLDAQAPLEVHDPFDGDEAVFQTCFNHISRVARPIARALTTPRENE